MLSTLGKSLRISCAALALLSEGNYSVQFTYPKEKNESISELKIKQDGAIALWLAKEFKPLKIADIPTIPELNQIPVEENTYFNDSKSVMFIPIKGREKMIGILALDNRKNGEILCNHDIEFALDISEHSGIVIENAQLYAQARHRANIDELTGLFNHRHFHERLFEEISRSSRFGDVFSILMIDLDCFKSYNDIYGHLHGDSILKKVGEIIGNNIRAIDVAARYGGDEFSVILPKSSIDSALRIADRLRGAVESEFNNEGVAITCSVGVAAWPTDGLMKEALIHAADSALYYVKKSGRNQVFTASKLATLNVSNKPSGQENNSLVLDTIYALAATVDAKDHYTYGHSKKVSKYAVDIATALGYSDEQIKVIRIAGLLHDIGKIGVSDDILGKNCELDDNEWKPIHAHPYMGVAILKHVDSIKECLPGVLYHHERYDGTGYPQRLKGENIPLDARILAVADSYDAMTSCRVYRDDSWTSGRAIEELIRCSGTQFDPNIVQVFIKLLPKTPPKGTRFVFTHQDA
jgi:diguanylate cyclase (GGDEF)-like protein/putative nucleotidyltransferase with HDIG domain